MPTTRGSASGRRETAPRPGCPSRSRPDSARPTPPSRQALAEGNRAYEEKFGQVFLIRAAGRSREEILAALNTRLAHTPGEEQSIIGQQLREIAVLRLEGLIGK